MDVGGAVIFDRISGDPEHHSGFVVDVSKPRDVTIHGNYDKGFYVAFKEAGIELGPYPNPAWAHMIAERWDGILERAN